MKAFDPPPTWDARKFATRYGLDRDKDFYVDSDGKLVVFPALPDDPPIFELPDPPKPPDPTAKELLAKIATLETDVAELKLKVK